MRYYECGNYSEREQHEYCPFCSAEQRDEQPRQYETIVITCDGWW